jgi:hypothetical protein
MPIHIIFGEVLGIIIIIFIFYNKVTSRSSSLPNKSIKFFVNLLNVG